MDAASNSKVKVDPINETAAQQLMGCLFDELTRQAVPWKITPQADQEAALARIRQKVEAVVTRVVASIARGGFDHIGVKIESLTVKDGAKCVLNLSALDAADLVDHVGSSALLVFADPAAYVDGMQVYKAVPDEPPLDLGLDDDADPVP